MLPLWTPEYLALPRPNYIWHIRPLLPLSGVLQFIADAKIGKSYAALQFAHAFSSGAPFLGFEVVHPGPVAYLQLDTPVSLWRGRLDKLATLLDLTRIVHHDKDTCPHMPFNILDPVHRTWLREWVGASGAALLIVDTYREAFRGDENDSDVGQRVMAALTQAITPASLLLIHHTAKPTPLSLSSQHGRGTSYLAGRVDGTIRLRAKRWDYTLREWEPFQVEMGRQPSGLWAARGLAAPTVALVKNDPSVTVTHQQAQKMAHLTGFSFEACRSALRRHETPTGPQK